MADFISQLGKLIAAHDYAGIGGILTAVLLTLLTDRAKFVPTWNSPLRPFLGSLAAALGLLLNQAHDGGNLAAILVSVLATSGPTLLAEFVAIWHRKATVASRALERGFIAHREIASVFSILLFFLVGPVLMAHCAALKPACQAIDLADKACEYILLSYVDSAGVPRQEAIPKSDLKATAEYHRIARMHETGAGGSKPAGQ